MFGESESSLNSGLVIQTADLQSLCQLHFTHHLFVHPPPMVPAHLVASAQRLLWNFQHSPSRGPRTLILACRPIERRRSRVRCLHALESVEPDAVFRDTSTRGTLKSLNNRRVRCRLLQSSSCASKLCVAGEVVAKFRHRSSVNTPAPPRLVRRPLPFRSALRTNLTPVTDSESESVCGNRFRFGFRTQNLIENCPTARSMMTSLMCSARVSFFLKVFLFYSGFARGCE